jgi:glycosyltransferase involved in cell wall biosynthesis
VHYHPWLLSRNDSIAVVAYQWAQALLEAGHRAELIGDEVSFPVESDVPVDGVRHVGKGPTLTPLGLGDHLYDDDVLVLHTDWRFANLYAARVARRKGVPYVVVPHGGYEPGAAARVRDPLRYRFRAERHLVRGATGIHVFFPTEVDVVGAFAPGARCVVAPTGFERPAEPTWKGGGGYLAWLGRYDIAHKGLDLLLQGLARLPAPDRPRLELRGIDVKEGDRETVQRLAVGLGVASSVNAGGPVFGGEKDRFLAEADGYVHPARWESYGLTILENLAVGSPCMVSSTGHLARHWQDRGPFVVADPTPEGLARALQDLRAADPDDLYRRGRALVDEQLAWPVVTAAFLDGIGRLLSDAGR